MTAPDDLREELGRLVDAAPTRPDRVDVVRHRARRIRRNRMAAAATTAAAAVVAVVLVGTTLAGSNRSAPVDPLAPPATRLPSDVLLVDQQGGVTRLPAMTDRVLQPVRDLRLRSRSRGGVAVAGGRVLAADPALDLILVDPARPGSATVLLRSRRVVPAMAGIGVPKGTMVPFLAIPGVGQRIVVRPIVERGGERIWLVTARTLAAALRDNGPFELYAMDLTGRVDTTPVPIPAGADPAVVGHTGVYALAGKRNGPTVGSDLVRVDRSGRVTVVRRNAAADSFAAGYGEIVVGKCCNDTKPALFDADTGRVVPIKPAGRRALDFLLPSFSVDGRYLVDSLSPPALPPVDNGETFDTGSGWAVVDTATGKTTLVPGSLRYGVRHSGPLPHAGWSGDRLIWIEDLVHGGSVVGAYLPVNGRSVVTSVPGHGLSLLGAS